MSSWKRTKTPIPHIEAAIFKRIIRAEQLDTISHTTQPPFYKDLFLRMKMNGLDDYVYFEGLMFYLLVLFYLEVLIVCYTGSP